MVSPARKSPVPYCEVRLTAQPCCGSALVSAVGTCTDVGSKSALLSRMNVFGVTRGARSGGMLSHGPENVPQETASGHESTRSEASVA
jgi:hypothetical protein